MHNLNDLEEIKKIDPKGALQSTDLMLQQYEAAWNQVNELEIPYKVEDIQNIIFCGMGASINGTLVLKSLIGRNMPYPSEIVSDYHLPDYVNTHTLVVLTSYSGTTEEVLSCAEEAKEKQAKMVVLTNGGKLAEFAKTNNIPAYIFDGKLNPAGTPRLGNGYTVLGLLGLLNKIGLITIEAHEISDAITRLKDKMQDFKNKAMNDVRDFEDTIPIIVAAEHLSGSAQILRNQFNETSKFFSAFYLVPDLNHHLMEGLQFPDDSKLYFIVLKSLNYSKQNTKRMELTVEVIKKNNHKVFEFECSGQTLYDDFLEVLSYGSYLTLYLAFLKDQNPSGNPWVDWFKGELKK